MALYIYTMLQVDGVVVDLCAPSGVDLKREAAVNNF